MLLAQRGLSVARGIAGELCGGWAGQHAMQQTGQVPTRVLK